MNAMKWLPLVALLSTGCAGTYSTLSEADHGRLFPLPPNAAVPEGPDVIIERRVVIDAPPERVYEILVDIQRWPDWDPGVTRTEPYAGRPLERGDRFYMNPGGYDTVAQVLEAEPGRLIRWRGEGGGIVGVHSHRLVEIAPNRTMVVNREEFHAWYLRPVGWFTDVGIGDDFQAALNALKARAEGEVEAAGAVAAR